MRVVLGIIFFINIVLGAGISLEDMQKYQQYKAMLDEGEVVQPTTKQQTQQEIKNDIVNLENNTTISLEKEEKNIFKYEYQDKQLKRYGESFFQNKNTLNSVAVPSANNYILNNGDTLFIDIYGAKTTKNYDLKIDNNGNINIPNIGLLKVASLKLDEAKTVISNIITKAFPNNKVIVDIAQYSSIQVVVTGNVQAPGIYNLSSFSTVKDALLASNGLLDIGSYRNIDIIRNGKVYKNFDLYDLLYKSKKTADIILKASDIVSVGFVEKSITLQGKVKYEAIYELKQNESFEDLMHYSGGFSFDATKDSIKLTRYDKNKELKTFLLSKNKFFSMTPQDGDKIEVFNNLEIKEKPYIYVHGKVVKDEKVKYSFFSGMTLQNLYELVTFRSEIVTDDINKQKSAKQEIAKQETAREALFVDKTNIKVVRHNDSNKRVFLVSLKDKFELEPFDEVEFFNYFDTNPRISAIIKGEVYNNGKFFIDKDTTFSELLKLAGGINDKAYTKEFELLRYKIVNNERVRNISKIDFEKALSEGFKIKPYDEIKIFTIPNWYDQKSITLKGEVKFPGTYTVKTGEKLSSVIQRAGGFTAEAFVDGALYTRESIKQNEEKRVKESMAKIKQQIAFMATNAKEAGAENKSQADLVSTISLLDQQTKEYEALGRLVVYLDKDLEKFKKSNYDIRVEDKDTLIIPSFNDTVSVYGEVMSPSSFVYNSELSSFDYIQKAGGFTQRADNEAIYLVKANGESKKVTNTFLFGSSDMDVAQGTTIIVPMQINQVSNVLLWKEVSQIVYQLAITAASLSTVGAL